MAGNGSVPGIDVERARAYVLAHGDVRARARLVGILDGARPEAGLVRALEQEQLADGGFSGASAASSHPTATCVVLSELQDLPPLAGSPMASRAVAYLRRVQGPEGSWGPADPEQVSLTALATYTLLAFDPGHLDPIVRGSGWLRRALGSNEAGVSLRTLACAAAIWYRVLGPVAHEVAWCFEIARARQWTMADLAWWLSTSLEAGVGGRFVLPLAGILSQLCAIQGLDGSWGADMGPAADPVEMTLRALRVVHGYGLA